MPMSEKHSVNFKELFCVQIDQVDHTYGNIFSYLQGIIFFSINGRNNCYTAMWIYFKKHYS